MVVNCFLGVQSRFCDGWATRASKNAPRLGHHIPGTLIILAGRDYANPILSKLHEHPHITTELPLDGMEIGQRLAWLNQELMQLRRVA